MARIKIDYGIDLGTTNSAISRMQNGEPVIKKTDTLKDTMPSCVYFNKKQVIQVGDNAHNALKQDKLKAIKNFNNTSNAFIEFKRTMGTDKKYHSSNMQKDFSSEELSAEILKTLKSFIHDENIKAIVVTVPAKFTANQKDATLRAAKIAGFEHCELLQEPIAASMAYGLDCKNKDGYWLVFDFGGGTFDVALLRVEEGIMKVIDTEGDNFLGGKNLDFAIVDKIIIPYMQENNAIESILQDSTKKQILQDAMKFYAEETKVQMSFRDTHNILSDLGDIPGLDDDDNEFELDITVTQSMLENALCPIFQKSIDICKELLKRNHISCDLLDALILVGGPTHSPILRKMLEEQLIKPDISADPMTVVSKGAALYASTIDIKEEIRESQKDKTKLQLQLGYEATTVEKEEFITVKINNDKAKDTSKQIFIDFIRGDKAWSSGKKEIGIKGEVIDVLLEENKPNVFEIIAYDEQANIIACEPSQITIIQGSKIANATLPYSFGIAVKNRDSNKDVFKKIKGLEINQSIPATGTVSGLSTQKQINPGQSKDFIKIPFYQGAYDAEGSRAIHNEHVYDVIISGEHLPKVLPQGSEVELSVKIDRSEKIEMTAYFPFLDFSLDVEVPRNTTQKEINSKWLEDEINKAEQTLNLMLEENSHNDVDKINELKTQIKEIKENYNQSKNDYDRKKEVLENLKRTSRVMDDVQDSSKWPKIEEELKDVFYQLEEINNEFGNEKTNQMIEDYKQQIPEIISGQNIKIAQETIEAMRELHFFIADEGMGIKLEIALLQNFNDDFEMLEWTDERRARNLLDNGLQLIANNPSKNSLRAVVFELYKLLPDSQKPSQNANNDLLMG